MTKQRKLRENEVLLKNGQVWKCHPKSVCAANTTPCVFHSPTKHRMDTWPLETRYDKSFWLNTRLQRPSYSGFRAGPYGDDKEDQVLLLLLERRCKHGVRHPDIDCVAWLESVYPSRWGVHACDGCCFDSSK